MSSFTSGVATRTSGRSRPRSAGGLTRTATGATRTLAATAPLDPRTTYNVRVSGSVQAAKGGKWVQFKTRTWSFTTA